MNLFDRYNEEIKRYFNILCPSFPDWLFDYINTSEIQRLYGIGLSCGTDYSKCFNIEYWYSNLEHSIGVALIIWQFTHNKKMTLSGLFHDIATPSFKHSIDFMNGDSEHQESTEERTTQILLSSKEIMSLLTRDGISIEEVNDYKLYPIADNDTPKLSSDRFEYTFSSGLIFKRVWNLDLIKEMYDNVSVLKNEDGIDELGFNDKEVCEKYIDVISNLWPEWVSDKDRYVMQFLADMCKSLNAAGYLSIDDLYKYNEKDVINIIKNCDDKYLRDTFNRFQQVEHVYTSSVKPLGVYSTNVKSKVRYVNPLVKMNDETARISNVSRDAKSKIDNYLSLNKGGNYVYSDLEFTPYVRTRV